MDDTDDGIWLAPESFLARESFIRLLKHDGTTRGYGVFVGEFPAAEILMKRTAKDMTGEDVDEQLLLNVVWGEVERMAEEGRSVYVIRDKLDRLLPSFAYEWKSIEFISRSIH